MSTTGLEDGPPLCTGSQIGDTGSGIHMVAAILAALYQHTEWEWAARGSCHAGQCAQPGACQDA